MKGIKIICFFLIILTLFCSCNQKVLENNQNISTTLDKNTEGTLWEKDSYKFEIVKDNIDAIDGVFLKIKYTNLNPENKDLKLTINSASLNGLNDLQNIKDKTETSLLSRIILMKLKEDNIYEFSYLYNEALGELKHYKLNLSCTVNNRTWEIPVIERGVQGEEFIEIDSYFKIYAKNNKLYSIDTSLRFPLQGARTLDQKEYKPIETIYIYSSQIPYDKLNIDVYSNDVFAELNFIDDNYETALNMLEQERSAMINRYEDIELLKTLHDLRNK